MTICIFCSANADIRPEYFEKTAELGKYLATRGHEVVYGGCNMGLMECIAEAVCRNGGKTIGVVPSKVEANVTPSRHITRRIDVPNLSVRKQTMMDISDIFIALPGGIGTLDEIFSVAASHTIGYHNKRVILFNINGFWNATLSMLEKMKSEGMLRGTLSDYIATADSIEDLSAYGI